jgi:hypothetical protein
MYESSLAAALPPWHGGLGLGMTRISKAFIARSSFQVLAAAARGRVLMIDAARQIQVSELPLHHLV